MPDSLDRPATSELISSLQRSNACEPSAPFEEDAIRIAGNVHLGGRAERKDGVFEQVFGGLKQDALPWSS
jgi:hypothetical protein